MFLGPCAVLFVLMKCDLAVQLDENSPCSGLGCRKTVSMPLLDQMKGNLKAEFDVSEMNKLLKDYIDQEIRSGVEIGLKNGVENIINLRMQQVQQETTSVIDKNMSTYISDFESKMTKLKQDNEKEFSEMKKETTSVIDKNMSTYISDFESKMTKLKQDNEKEFSEMKKVSKKYAFFATLSSDRSYLPENSVVMFDTVSLNEGDAYDGTTGIFTCPEDGLYHFSWTTVTNAGKDFTSVLVANHRRIAENAVDSDSVSDAMTGTSNVIVRMMKRQKAWIGVIRGKNLKMIWSESLCSMFSGFKL